VFCLVDSWLTGKRLVAVPFSDHCDLLIDPGPDLGAICTELSEDLERQKLQYIEFRSTGPVGAIECELKCCASYYLHHIDLQQSIADLFKKLHKNSTQRKIRRAEREGIKYEEGHSEALLEAFNRLWIPTRRRHFVPPQPASWFRNLIECFGDALKIRVASKDEQPIAAILTVLHKDVLIYKYGCSDSAFHRYGGVHLLLWRAILDAKRDGLSVFDMGRTELSNKGLVTFKDRWGSTRTNLHYSTLSNVPAVKAETRTEKSNWKEQLVKRIIPFLPDSAFKVVGCVMYRHLG
jgi:lipid II:glycine glycyltransferase (peptidoglycan interpeptide bridge formation enzyme)